MKKIFIVFGFLVLLGLINCDIQPSSEPIIEQQLIGIYSPNFDAGIAESIELINDSIYIHYFKSSDSEGYLDTNIWMLQYRSDDSTHPRLTFINFIDRYPKLDKGYSASSAAHIDTTPFRWEPFVYKWGNTIQIERSPYVNQYYEKLE